MDGRTAGVASEVASPLTHDKERRPRRGRAVSIRLFVAGCLGVAGGLPAAQAAEKVCGLPPGALIRNFGNIAFGYEHKPGQATRLTRWQTPVRYRAVDRVGVEAPVLEDLHRHMRLLARLTGHPIRQASHPVAANFIVIFTRLERFGRTIARHLNRADPVLLRRLRRADCIGIMQRRRSTNAIVRAVAIIPVDHARERGLLHHCIVEETTQLMGLPNDSDDADFSIFNDRARQDDLGCQDKLFLRLLYNPALRLGMTKQQALRALPAILQKFRASTK